LKKKVTIGDIAAQSRVSPSTVSLILNNKPGVSDETRERVLDVAAELGYPIRPLNSTNGGNALLTIGMIVKIDPDILPQANPFYSKVIMGIEDACRRSGINLLFSSLPVDENNRLLEIPPLMYNDSVDGLLLVGVSMDETFAASAGRRMPPIVLVDGYSSTNSYDTVVSDNFGAAYRAVEQLITLGHRSIGLAGSCEHCFTSLRERRNGYLRALKDNGLYTPCVANFNINKTKGFDEITRLLQDHPQLTALFCVNDDVANAALRAAHALGRRIPEDISIIGYDDTYIAANTRPALTTMHVDTVAMGRAAVRLLALRLETPDASRMTLTIHPTLVERESTGVAPKFPVEKESILE